MNDLRFRQAWCELSLGTFAGPGARERPSKQSGDNGLGRGPHSCHSIER